MGKDHKGRPPGPNKKEEVGIKPVMPAENLEINDDKREKHTNEDKLADIKKRHPNRNRSKEDSTNAGGYRQ